MKLTLKQRELIDELLGLVRSRFPDTRLLSMHESPESDNDIWVNIAVPDEDVSLAISELVSMREAEILLETGYMITIMPRREEAIAI